MASFVHVEQPVQHPGVARAIEAADSIRGIAHSFDGARGAASLLLAAIVSALLVVANRVIDTWSDGHLLVAWIALWCVAFAAMALFAAPARRLAVGLRNTLKTWKADRKAFKEDQKLWNVALQDAGVMADLSRAMSRDGMREVRGYY